MEEILYFKKLKGLWSISEVQKSVTINDTNDSQKLWPDLSENEQGQP